MKGIFIAYNQALYDDVVALLHQRNIRGFTAWEEVSGRGSYTGEPHLGSHAWPTLNGAMLVFLPSDKATQLLEALRQLDTANPEQGLRAFEWEVTRGL